MTSSMPQASLAKKPLAIYNMWPRNYNNALAGQTALQAMTADVERIAQMGFNTVYVNPFYAVGQSPKEDQGLTGSLYASSDMLSANPVFFGGKEGALMQKVSKKKNKPTEQGEQVQAFCAEIRKHGMVPMFDLVQSHLSPDSPHIAKAREAGITIMKRHDNGNFAIHNLDKNYKAKTDMVTGAPFTPQHIWDDVVKFNYDDPKAKQYIIKHILTPYVEQMAELGFRGIRIDSTPETPPDVHRQVVQAFKNKVKHLEPDFPAPPILAETLNNQLSPAATEVEDVATHCYSSGYFFPNEELKDFNTLIGTFTQNNSNHWLKSEMWLKQHGMDGGAIIPVSTHDEERLRARLKNVFSSELSSLSAEEQEKHLQKLARIKIAFSAFFSSGGYMMVSGDEFLIKERPSVFDGRVVQGEGHEYAPGARLTQEQVEAITQKAEETNAGVTNPLTYEIDGKPYYFLTRQGYAKPVSQWKDQTPPEKETILVQLNPQKKIPVLLQEHAQNKGPANKSSLPDFIRQINQAVQQRQDISANFYSDVYFTAKDPNLLCIVGRTSPAQTVQDITLIDVSGLQRQRDIAPGILEDFAQQASLTASVIDEKAVRVGNFPDTKSIGRPSKFG